MNIRQQTYLRGVPWPNELEVSAVCFLDAVRSKRHAKQSLRLGFNIQHQSDVNKSDHTIAKCPISKCQMSKCPNVQMPNFQMSKCQMPNVQVSNAKCPNVQMSKRPKCPTHMHECQTVRTRRGEKKGKSRVNKPQKKTFRPIRSKSVSKNKTRTVVRSTTTRCFLQQHNTTTKLKNRHVTQAVCICRNLRTAKHTWSIALTSPHTVFRFQASGCRWISRRDCSISVHTRKHATDTTMTRGCDWHLSICGLHTSIWVFEHLGIWAFGHLSICVWHLSV